MNFNTKLITSTIIKSVSIKFTAQIAISAESSFISSAFAVPDAVDFEINFISAVITTIIIIIAIITVIITVIINLAAIDPARTRKSAVRKIPTVVMIATTS